MSNSSNSNSSTVLLNRPQQNQSSLQPSVSQSQINTNPLKRNNNITPKQLDKPNQNNQNNQNTQRNTRSKVNPNSSPMNRFLNNPTTPSQANIPNNAPKLNNNNRPKLNSNLLKTSNNLPKLSNNNAPKQTINNAPKPRTNNNNNASKLTNNVPKSRTNNNISEPKPTNNNLPKPKATNNNALKATNNIKKNNQVNNTQNNTNNEQTFNSFSVPFPKLEYKLPDRFKKIGDMNTSNTAKAGVAIGSVIVLILVFLSLVLLTK